MSLDYDQTLLKIFLKEKANFFDAIFGFLHRNTDFYDESGPDKKSGLSPGEAERVVLNSFRKWKKTPKFHCPTIDSLENHNLNVQTVERTEDNVTVITEETGPQIVQEIEVETSMEPHIVDEQVHREDTNKVSDSYNGAVRDDYTWSQSISDLDVLIKLPYCIKTAKDLRVNIDSMHIEVEAKTSILLDSDVAWPIIFSGELCHKIKKNESVWSVVPGKHISIHFEKASERWWEAFLVGEPKIDLNKIDCSRHLDDMRLEEQMKVQELMWNHQQKLLGKPTSEEIRMEKILKKAWNAKGSPFEGTPYDPSVLKFSN